MNKYIIYISVAILAQAQALAFAFCTIDALVGALVQ